MIKNSLQRASCLPPHHILNHMASTPTSHHSVDPRKHKRPVSNSIWLLKESVHSLLPLMLNHPATCVGNRLLDNTLCIRVTIPAAPPRKSKVFDQWAKGWISTAQKDCIDITSVGMDGSYKLRVRELAHSWSSATTLPPFPAHDSSQRIPRTTLKCKPFTWPSNISMKIAMAKSSFSLTISQRSTPSSTSSRIHCLSCHAKTALLSVIGLCRPETTTLNSAGCRVTLDSLSMSWQMLLQTQCRLGPSPLQMPPSRPESAQTK